MDNVNTNFQGQKIPKENAPSKCFSLITIDSVMNVNKKYYPQTLLGEYKYEINNNKMENCLNDDLEPGSSDESVSETDSESDNEQKNPCKKNYNESNNDSDNASND